MTRHADPAHRRAIALLALCGIFWSTGGLLIKLVDWNPIAIWSVRSALAASLLWLVRRPGLRGINRREWAAAAALASTTGLFILANKLTTAANAIVIQYSAPVWIALFGAWFLGERASRWDWLTIGVVLGGISLFFFDQLTFDHVAGNVVALGAGVAFAFSTMTLRWVAAPRGNDDPGGDPMRAVILGNVGAALIGLPAVFGGPAPDPTGWAALVALGLIQQGAAYICFTWAIRHATALEGMLIPIIEPILSPLWVALAIGELPGRWALIGGALVVGSVTVRAVVSAQSLDS